MKKFTKFIYFILAFALITCMSIFNPVINSVDAVELPDNTISISSSKVSNTITQTEDFKIPMPTVTGASAEAKTYVEVTDKSGSKFEYLVGEDSNENNKYFALLDENGNIVTTGAKYVRPAKLSRGTYVVRYRVEDNGKVYYSSSQYVKVEGVTYSWQMEEENTAKNIIPSVTAAGASFNLPLPKIINSDNEVVYDFSTAENIGTIEVYKNGVKLTDAPEFRIEDGKAIFTPTMASNGETTTYTIKYKSSESSLADKKFTVKVESNYSNVAELEVTHNNISAPQVGAVTTFPTANVTDKTHNETNVEVNTTIVIKKDGVEYVRLATNQYKYTFTEKGEFYVYYEVEDAYGNKAVSSGKLINVTDRAPYVIDYAKDYDTSIENWEDSVITGASYLVPSEMGYGGFYLPAIYAKDYVDAYSDLEFKRVLELKTDSSVTYDIDKAEDNGALDADNVDYSKAIKFEFPEETEEEIKAHAGQTFKVKYSAKDKAGNTVYATVYEIKIANVDILSYNVDKGLKIDFPTIIDRIDPNEELSFETATASEVPEDDELTADARIEVRTYYYYGNATEFTTAYNSYMEVFKTEHADYTQKYGYDFDEFLNEFKAGLSGDVYELENKSGKTTLKLNDYVAQPTVSVIAVGINDQNQFVYNVQEIEVKNTVEINPPTIVEVIGDYDLSGRTKFDQNETVVLPGIKFTDAEDDYLQVDAECYVRLADDSIKYLDVNILNFLENGIAEGGAQVNAVYAGTYYITYTATDDAGNKVSYLSTFEVANTTKAHIEVKNGSNISINAGDEVRLVLDLVGGGDIDDGSIKYTITWGNNTPSGLGSSENSFKFKKAGTYVATISATYDMNGSHYTAEPSVTVTVNVTAPSISWDKNVDGLLEDTIADIGDRVVLPDVLAGDAVVTRKITYKDEDGNVTDITSTDLLQDEDTYEWYFIASKNGVYTVTFVASNEYDSSDEKSYTITCGDYYEPIIVIANNKLQDSNITYNNENITFKVDSFTQKENEDGVKIDGEYTLKVSATEGDTTLFSYDIDVHLDDQDENNAIVALNGANPTFSLSGNSYSSNGTKSWTITGVGSYTLKITVRDANGNSATKSIIFNVSSKAEPKEKNDNVVGIVLIVISAVVLCGVILFFALAGKRKPKKRVIKVEDTKQE